jgi:hypothetical protein
MECKECFGSGQYEIGPECDKPASMCCGGCYKKVKCEKCNGTGIIKMNTPIDEIYRMWHSKDQREFDRWFAVNKNTLNKNLMEMMEKAYYAGFNEELPFASFEDYINGIENTGETD